MTQQVDIQTQQQHRAALRRAFKKNPQNQTIIKALQKSLRPKYIRQAAQEGIFICYCMQDGVFALSLALDLQAAGLITFMDEIDADDTNDWGAEIGNALTSCGVMVLVVSPDSFQDAQVQGERLYFLRNGKIIVPVVARVTDKRPRGTFIMPIDCTTDYDAGKATLLELLAPASDSST